MRTLGALALTLALTITPAGMAVTATPAGAFRPDADISAGRVTIQHYLPLPTGATP